MQHEPAGPRAPEWRGADEAIDPPTNDDLLHGGAGWADAAAGAVADTTAAKEEANEAEREGADLTPEAGETGRSRGAPGRG